MGIDPMADAPLICDSRLPGGGATA
jgi:hypothetical protein